MPMCPWSVTTTAYIVNALRMISVFFFFQAEDGIRDKLVTGVQTCALPIYMAVTRFSGRRAPDNPKADSITREAYSHEVSSCGWWPGSGAIGYPAFYAYAAPQPDGFKEAKIEPSEAVYNDALSIFVLPHDAVRKSADPEDTLLRFCQST